MAKIIVLDVAGTKLLYLDAGGTKQAALSDTFFWVNDDADGLWNNANNWASTSGGVGGLGVPGPGDKVVFDGGDVTDCQLDVAITIGELDMQAGFTGTIDGLTDSLDHAITGDTTFAGTKVDMGDGTWTVGGNWSNNSVSTFNRNLSTLVLNGTSKTIIASKTKPFNNVTIDGSYTLDSATSVEMVVGGAFLINAGKLLTLEDTLVIQTATVFGTLTINASRFLTMASGADLLVKTGGTVDGAGTNAMSLSAKISEQAGTYSVANTTTRRSVTITDGTYGGTWLHRANAAASTVTLGDGASQTLIFTGLVTFRAEDFNLNVNNNTNNPDIEFQGDAALEETGAGGTLNWNKGTGKITFSGATATQTFTALDKSLEDIVLDKSSGTLVIADDTTTESFAGTDGILDCATNDPNLTISGDCILDNDQVDMGDGIWTVSGDFDNVNVTSFNRNLSTLVMNGTGKNLIGSQFKDLNNVTIDGTITSTNDIDIINLTVNSGKTLTCDNIVRSNNGSISNNGGTITGAGTIRAAGSSITNTGIWTVADTAIFNDSNINPGTYGGSLAFSGNGTTTTINAGAFIFTGTVGFDAEFSGAFTVENNATSIEFQDNVTVDSTGSGGTTVTNSSANMDFKKNLTITETVGTVTYNKGSGMIKFTATSGTVNLTSIGKDLESVTQDGPGSTLNFVDDLSTVNLSSLQGITDFNSKTFTVSGALMICGATGGILNIIV